MHVLVIVKNIMIVYRLTVPQDQLTAPSRKLSGVTESNLLFIQNISAILIG